MLYDLIRDLLESLYTPLMEARDLEDILGLEPHSINDPSEKCKLVLERGLTPEVCRVACRAWQLIEEDQADSWRDAIKRAWAEAKQKCFELGVVV